MNDGLLKLTLTYRGSECAPVNDDSFLRRVVAPAEFSLAFLHEVIQAAFGWRNCHLYAFRKGDVSYMSPDYETDKVRIDEIPAPSVPAGAIFKKAGDKCTYEYDFGDCNLVEIECTGKTHEIAEIDFEAKGQDLIEDALFFDYTPGIVGLLSAKKRSAKARECIDWLNEAFRLTPEEVLRVPTALEIGHRVSRLIELVEYAIPRADEP